MIQGLLAFWFRASPPVLWTGNQYSLSRKLVLGKCRILGSNLQDHTSWQQRHSKPQQRYLQFYEEFQETCRIPKQLKSSPHEVSRTHPPYKLRITQSSQIDEL